MQPASKARSSPTSQRCSGPVCNRPRTSWTVPFSQNRLQRRLEAVLTGLNGPGRAGTVANSAGTALTGAVRTGLSPSISRSKTPPNYCESDPSSQGIYCYHCLEKRLDLFEIIYGHLRCSIGRYIILASACRSEILKCSLLKEVRLATLPGVDVKRLERIQTTLKAT